MKASYMMRSSSSIERALPGRTSVSVSLIDSRGVDDMRVRSINTFLPGTYDPATDTGVVPYPNQGSIYLYENTGLYKEMQVIASVNSRLNRHVTLNGYYAFSDYHTNTFGFPSNQYDTAVDWGRASGVPLNSVYVIGSIELPFKWSGFSFDLRRVHQALGQHHNGRRMWGTETGSFNDRPSFAPPGAACGGNIVCTRIGDFDLAPAPGEIRFRSIMGTARINIARICASAGPGVGEGAAIFHATPPTGRAGNDRFAGYGTIPSTNARYNMGLTVQATDVFNHVDLANPQGRLNSPFSMSRSIRPAAELMGNRRIQLTLRFTY